MPALKSKSVVVDSDVVGLRWEVDDLDELAKLIAIIALGQAEHASRILGNLEPNEPALSHADLYIGARGQLRIKGATEAQKTASRHHRDGFIFECISWIAARQESDKRTFLKDPHISATSQGLDGLMIQLHPKNPEILRTTIFEDKCTTSPRKMFQQQVMHTFTEHHEGKRSRELVAVAVSLIKESGVNGTAATQAAVRVLDLQFRTYRAALTVDRTVKSSAKRAALFRGYKDLGGITKEQRLGATFVLETPLRDWFQLFSDLVIVELNKFEAANV